MADHVDEIERIDALLSAAEVQIRRAFLAAITALADDLDLDKIEQLLSAGQLEEALQYTQDVAQAIGSSSAVVFFNAGQSTADFLSGLDVGTILFNRVNTQALAALQDNSLRLIREFTAEQREATRVALTNGITRGLNPRDQARAFRDSVGLTANQQAAVDNYRSMLEGSAEQKREALTRSLRDKRFDSTVKTAAKNDAPLTPDQIERMVGRYRERYVKYRAEVIGRTEALRSVNQGVEEAYRQAIESGKLDPDSLTRTWDSSHDARVRLTHQLLDGQVRGWGEHWQTEHGTIRYPGDPSAPASETVQCRCVLLYRIKAKEQQKAA